MVRCSVKRKENLFIIRCLCLAGSVNKLTTLCFASILENLTEVDCLDGTHDDGVCLMLHHTVDPTKHSGLLFNPGYFSVFQKVVAFTRVSAVRCMFCIF